MVVGFVDDEPQARRLAGVPVLGGINDIPELVKVNDIDEVIISASAGPDVIRRVLDMCVEVNVQAANIARAGHAARTQPQSRTFVISS